jgi:hypothetical protein
MNALSCVVDNHPRFLVEAILWATCCRRHLPHSAYDISVYFVDIWPERIVSHFESLGINCMKADVLLSDARHCNKIIPFLSSEDAETYDYRIVTDTDLYIVKDIGEFLRSDRVRAAPNNHCSPPLGVFEAIVRESGLASGLRPGVSLFGDSGGRRETHLNNASGGIVCIPAAKRRRIAERWLHWARWLIEHRKMLQRWSVHVDQVAFCLTMEEAKEDIEFLPPQSNAVLELLAKVSDVYAFHMTSGHIPRYRRAFRKDKTLKASYFGDGARASMERLNDAILEAVEVAQRFEETRDFLPNFHNPAWRRSDDPK